MNENINIKMYEWLIWTTKQYITNKNCDHERETGLD